MQKTKGAPEARAINPEQVNGLYLYAKKKGRDAAYEEILRSYPEGSISLGFNSGGMSLEKVINEAHKNFPHWNRLSGQMRKALDEVIEKGYKDAPLQNFLL